MEQIITLTLHDSDQQIITQQNLFSAGQASPSAANQRISKQKKYIFCGFEAPYSCNNVIVQHENFIAEQSLARF